MPGYLDLTGHRFGRLVCIAIEHRAKDCKSGTTWRCRCDCGNETVVSRGNLKNGSTMSCGCLRNTQGGHTRKHPLWKAFYSMHSRCEKERDKDYTRYGARGISVCERWSSFPNFLKDMEPTYRPGLTLDREDNNGPYSPENCRWATAKQQGRNRRTNIFIDTPWGRMTVAEAAERMKLPRTILHNRIAKGWSNERLFDPENFKIMSGWSRRASP